MAWYHDDAASRDHVPQDKPSVRCNGSCDRQRSVERKASEFDIGDQPESTNGNEKKSPEFDIIGDQPGSKISAFGSNRIQSKYERSSIGGGQGPTIWDQRVSAALAIECKGQNARAAPAVGTERQAAGEALAVAVKNESKRTEVWSNCGDLMTERGRPGVLQASGASAGNASGGWGALGLP